MQWYAEHPGTAPRASRPLTRAHVLCNYLLLLLAAVYFYYTWQLGGGAALAQLPPSWQPYATWLLQLYPGLQKVVASCGLILAVRSAVFLA